MEGLQSTDTLPQIGWLRNRIGVKLALDPIFNADSLDFVEVAGTRSEAKPVQGMQCALRPGRAI
jgi:hypothetical protein